MLELINEIAKSFFSFILNGHIECCLVSRDVALCLYFISFVSFPSCQNIFNMK